MQRESPLTLIVAHQCGALLQQTVGNLTHLGVPLIHVRLDFLEMHLAAIVHHSKVVKQAVHVTFQRCILVNLAVAKLLDGAWYYEMRKALVTDALIGNARQTNSMNGIAHHR